MTIHFSATKKDPKKVKIDFFRTKASMKPLKALKYMEDDPLDALAAILFQFIPDGLTKSMALRYFLREKPRVRAIIRGNKKRLIELIERI